MLQEYNFKVVHRLGQVNMDVNGLSKNPCLSQKDSPRAQWHVGEDEEERLGVACMIVLEFVGDA